MIRDTIPALRYDVVVAGARCAGAATALLLARAGHRVLLIDRGRYGTDALSTHALMRGGVVQLHRWRVLPEVIASGTAPVRKATFYYGADAVTVPIAPRDGIDALYAPRRHVLDRLLVDAAAAAGADVVFGVHLRDLQRTAGGRVAGVVLENDAGEVHRLASRVVVGADGLRSTVARLVDAAAYRVGRHASATMYGHWSGLDVDGYGWYFVEGLSAAAIPTNAGQVCVSLSVPGAEFTRLFAHRPDRAFRELLARVAPDLAKQIDGAGHARLSGFGGQEGFFRRAHGPGWALVGDAGYFKDPLTAHGITDALRDAELLAAAIGAESDAALAEYQEQRDAASLALFEATDEIASFNWNLTSVRPLHEALARAMSREVKLLLRT
ncbi:MAG TPA: FAD-dependent monooxygenase [Vicinamibacterales bacterium]|nr:FAD-dependent monooxygenase [Vicinamibacterales bacterium]